MTQTVAVLLIAVLIGWMLNGPLGLVLGVGYLVWLARRQAETDG